VTELFKLLVTTRSRKHDHDRSVEHISPEGPSTTKADINKTLHSHTKKNRDDVVVDSSGLLAMC
jgi:hypothetical protein